jgi:hypothetical protein
LQTERQRDRNRDRGGDRQTGRHRHDIPFSPEVTPSQSNRGLKFMYLSAKALIDEVLLVCVKEEEEGAAAKSVQLSWLEEKRSDEPTKRTRWVQQARKKKKKRNMKEFPA